MRPQKINILGVDYAVTYTATPSDVDIYKRTSCWGQIDFWTRTMRVYDNHRPDADILETILHEVLHGILEALHVDLKVTMTEKGSDDTIDLIALGLADVLVRNGWLKTE